MFGVVMEPQGALSPTLSFVSALLLGGGITALFVTVLSRFLGYRGRMLRAESIAKRGPMPLAPGPTLLQGTVETENGAPAVRIEIDQIGTERKNKNSWSHEWKEQHRHVMTRPFRLRLPNDEIVMVMPEDKVRLVDDLTTEKFDGNRRMRIAQLTHKEVVWISGFLSQGAQKGHQATSAYRAGPSEWVLRGTMTEPLEVSSGDLKRQFSYWLGFHKVAAILMGIIFAAIHVIAFGHYYALLVTGQAVTADITQTSTYVTRNKRTLTTHYVIHGEFRIKSQLIEVKDEVRQDVFVAAKSGDVKQAPFVYSTVFPALHSIGHHAVQSSVLVAVAWFVLVACLLLYFSTRSFAMPWYEQSKVKESGSGMLSESAWNIQVAGEKGKFIPGKPKQE